MPCVRGLRTWVSTNRSQHLVWVAWRVCFAESCNKVTRHGMTKPGTRMGQTTHLDLEEVLGRAVDLVKRLLASVWKTGHGLHYGFLEAGDGPLGCRRARRGGREGRRLVRRCRSAIGARGVVAVRSRFDGIERIAWVFAVYEARSLRPGPRGGSLFGRGVGNDVRGGWARLKATPAPAKL